MIILRLFIVLLVILATAHQVRAGTKPITIAFIISRPEIINIDTILMLVKIDFFLIFYKFRRKTLSANPSVFPIGIRETV